MSRTRRWRAIVAYDGTDFSGFQIQRSRAKQRTEGVQGTGRRAPRTVQGTLEDALAQILQQPTPLLAAGRTDSGVHAVGQVVAFAADWERSLADLHRALNAVLPDDVAVRELSMALPGFHPRYDALSRTYCYTIWNHPLRSPLLRRYTLWVRQPLDVVAMNEAAYLLVGSHDFASFGRAPRARTEQGTDSQPSTVRHVVRAEWSKTCEGGEHVRPVPALLAQMAYGEKMPADPTFGAGSASEGKGPEWQGLLNLILEANAFLYRMVRSIVGTLIQVGRRDLSVSEFASVLSVADRDQAGPTVPPQGLCLVGVRYPNEY